MTLTIEDFGVQLVKSRDLDPVYVALDQMTRHERWQDPGQLRRWLVAYWCLYHCGVASYLSELQGQEFWEVLTTAAENIEAPPVGERWPRGRERRHWRGEAAMNSVHFLRGCYALPEMLVNWCVGGSTLKDVTHLVKCHVGFGPWIAFKVADMLERVLGCDIHFNDAEVMMFKDPTQAALMVWDLWGEEGSQRTASKPYLTEQGKVVYVARELVHYFAETRGLLAPPSMNRPVNIQEVETILCKWKSHVKGHYPVGLDSREIREATHAWRTIPTAAAFLEYLPSGDVPVG